MNNNLNNSLNHNLNNNLKAIANMYVTDTNTLLKEIENLRNENYDLKMKLAKAQKEEATTKQQLRHV